MEPAGREAPTVDEALETLRLLWGDAYQISRTPDGWWTAVGTGDTRRMFTGRTPGELEAEMRADWAREGTL